MKVTPIFLLCVAIASALRKVLLTNWEEEEKKESISLFRTECFLLVPSIRRRGIFS